MKTAILAVYAFALTLAVVALSVIYRGAYMMGIPFAALMFFALRKWLHATPAERAAMRRKSRSNINDDSRDESPGRGWYNPGSRFYGNSDDHWKM